MRRLAIVLTAVLSLLVAGCGDDDPTLDAGDGTTTTTPPDPIGEDPDDGLDEGDDALDPDDDLDPDADRPPYLDGFEVDYETGAVDISAYEAFLAEHGGPSGGPEAAALEMLGSRYADDGEGAVEPELTTEPADGGRTVVIVTFDGLLDDSVAAERYELVFIGDGDDLILESGSWASRCQPGRGHQEFGLGLCL